MEIKQRDSHLSLVPFNLTSDDIRYFIALEKLLNEFGHIKMVLIANALGVSRPAVTKKMQRFIRMNFIVQEKRNIIALTEDGLAIVQELRRRIDALKTFLHASCCVDESLANQITTSLVANLEEESLEDFLDIICV